jgi:hypothetical protein
MARSGYRGLAAFPDEYDQTPVEDDVFVRRDAEPDRGQALLLLTVAPLFVTAFAALILVTTGSRYSDHSFSFASVFPSAGGIALALYVRRLAVQDLLRIGRGEIYPDPKGEMSTLYAKYLAGCGALANALTLTLGLADGIVRCL